MCDIEKKMAAVPQAPFRRVKKSARWKSRIIERWRVMVGFASVDEAIIPAPRMNPIYRSEINRDVPPAAPGEFGVVAVGPLRVWPPVVLAPMAGVTNPPFRTLCRRYGAGLYVSEMITARALVEGNRKTALLASFGS